MANVSQPSELYRIVDMAMCPCPMPDIAPHIEFQEGTRWHVHTVSASVPLLILLADPSRVSSIRVPVYRVSKLSTRAERRTADYLTNEALSGRPQ